MENKSTQIVLLGGGYVSIWAYRSLLRKLRPEISSGSVRITVVCPEQYHFFHGWTAESLTCIVQDKNRMSPLADIFSGATLICGSADEIDHTSNRVYVKLNDRSRLTVSYDHLLIGIGSYDNGQIEGISRYGHQIKSHAAYQQTKQAILSIVKQAAATPEYAAKLLQLTVAGSGFSGVELVTNTAEFINILKKDYPSLQNVKATIRLVNSRNKVMDVLDPRFIKMRRYAEKIMLGYGIEIINNKKIRSVTEDGVFLDDGTFLQSSIVISAIGQSRMVLKGTEGMQRDKLNRIYTNRYLQLAGYENIWGGGDACNVMHCKTMLPCASNALWAMKHGVYAARNIANTIKQKPLHAFTYKGLGQCASLGIGKGMGELYGIEFTGWIAWIMRWFFFNYYMPSRKVMLREVADWMYLLFSGKRKAICLQDKRTETVIESMLIPSNDSSSSNLARGKDHPLEKRPAFIS
jgi:NADH dehydrogenase